MYNPRLGYRAQQQQQRRSNIISPYIHTAVCTSIVVVHIRRLWRNFAALYLTSHPPPRATPPMAATTGTLEPSIAATTARRSGVRLTAWASAISLMSAPALKALFPPVMTTSDTCSSCCARLSPSSMPTRTSWLRGLRGGLHSLAGIEERMIARESYSSIGYGSRTCISYI